MTESILSWCVGERMEGIVVLISAIIDFFFSLFLYIPAPAHAF